MKRLWSVHIQLLKVCGMCVYMYKLFLLLELLHFTFFVGTSTGGFVLLMNAATLFFAVSI